MQLKRWILSLVLIAAPALAQNSGYSPPTQGTGLSLRLGGGTCTTSSGTQVTYPGALISLTANSTTYGYLDSNCAVQANNAVSAFPAGTIPIFKAVTGVTDVSSITDARSSYNFVGSSSGGSGTSPTQPAFLVTAAPYNAKCDGSTDDTAAIQAAENAAEATNGAATVIFPAGQCNYSSTLTITKSGIQWLGQAMDKTVLVDTVAGNDFLDITGPSFPGRIVNGSITNITFQRSLAFTGNPNGILFTNVAYWDIDHVDVIDSANCFNLAAVSNIHIRLSRAASNLSTVTNGYFVQTSSSSYITDSESVTFGHSITNSLNISNAAADLWVERFNVAAGGGIVSLTGSAGNPSTQDVHFNQLIVETATAGAAIQISGVNNNQCGLSTPCQITFVDTHIANSSGPAILCTGCQGVNFIASDIRCPATGNCVSFTGANSLNNQFNNNWVRTVFSGSNSPTFLSLNGVKNSTFNNNQFFGTSNAPFVTGISAVSSTNNSIAGNTLSGNGTTGISLDSASTGNQLALNTIDPTNITTAISDSSGGSASGSFSSSGFPFFMDPTHFVFFWDDFTSGAKNTTTGTAFVTGGMNLTWVTSLGGVSPQIDLLHPTDSGTAGVVAIQSGSSSTNFAQLFGSEFVSASSIAQSTFPPLNTSTFDVRIRSKISTTATATMKIGFTDPANTSFIGIQYDTTAGDTLWMGVCNNAGTATRSQIAGSTLDTNYHDFRFRSTTAGTVKFSVDGGTEISIATNLPTLNMSPQLLIQTQQNAAETLSVDYLWGWIAITR